MSEERTTYEAVRVYTPCPNCGGWSERWEMVDGPAVPGRQNHLRTCDRALFEPTPDRKDPDHDAE